MQTNPFLGVVAGNVQELLATHTFGQAGHLWRQEEIDALILARASQRPLLVRGEAGSGKSQLARAAALALAGCQDHLFVEVLHARYEALDLLYRFDAVERLADAELHQIKNTEKYVKPGKLWQAMEAENRGVRAVLLIDEIDKAEADIPNALLGVLGNRSFSVSMTDQEIKAKTMPLVIITTNEERELPPAFVRRCIVLNLNPPKKNEQEFIGWLIERGKAHKHLDIESEVRTEAAQQVWKDRQAGIRDGYYAVGLAEYLDLLTALDDLTRHETGDSRTKSQQKWLRQLSAYALVKGADQDQARKSLKQDD